jgi:hypothetical protein
VVTRVDMGRTMYGGGNFNPTDSYPDPASPSDGSNFLVSVSAAVTIPIGEWTMWVASDDGRILNMPGIDFYSVVSNLSDGGHGTSIIGYEYPTGHSNSRGTFRVDVETTVNLSAMFWERTGGDSFELAVAKGEKTNAADFHVLGDGVLGWGVKRQPNLIAVVPVPNQDILYDDLFNQGACNGSNLYNYPNGGGDFGFTFPTPPTFSGTITIEFKIGIVCGSTRNETVYLNDIELRSLTLNEDCSCSPRSPKTFIVTTTSNYLVGGGGENTLRVSAAAGSWTGFSPVVGTVYAIITYSA